MHTSIFLDTPPLRTAVRCLALLVLGLIASGVCRSRGAAAQTPSKAQPPDKPVPDLADAHYGPHPRQIFDLWQAAAPRPTPLVVFIHGGGFRGGNKTVLSATMLKALLEKKISVMAIHYRLSPEVSFPTHFHDAARAIQFARLHAQEWKIDPLRVGAAGNSAGAGTALWLGMHNDLANPASADPVLRESSRLLCVAARGGQSSYDPRIIREWVGRGAATHPVLPDFWGLQPNELDSPRAHRIYEASSPTTHLTADDPPVYAYHGEAAAMPPPDQRADRGIHHINFGLQLKQRMDQLGIECIVRRSDEGADCDLESAEFLARHLQR